MLEEYRKRGDARRSFNTLPHDDNFHSYPSRRTEGMIKKTLYATMVYLCTMSMCSADTLKISFPQSIWVQKRGDTVTGPIIDLLNEIFEGVDVIVAPEILPWARAISRMKSGEIDMIPVIFYTPERARYIEFSAPYADVPASIFVPFGKVFPFTTLDDLKGKRGVMVRRDSISTEFKAFEINLNISKVATYEQLLKMLAAKRADYAVAAQHGFLIEAKKLGYSGKIEMLPKPVASRSLHFGISKKSSFLTYLPLINTKLEQLRSDGTIDRMVKRTIQMAAEHETLTK